MSNTWCKYLPEEDRYETTKVITWSKGKKNSDCILLISPGFKFESSVPKFLTWILNPHDPKYLLSACVHDKMLEENYRPFVAAGEWYGAALKNDASFAKALFMAIAVTLWTEIRRYDQTKYF